MTVPRTMKAAVLHAADDLRVVEWPVPAPGPGEVLLRVAVASICGTDVKVAHRALAGLPPGPFVMGHEYAGTVAALGPGVDGLAPGDRVTVQVHRGCGQCLNCRVGLYTACLHYGDRARGHRANGLTGDGGFAEYVVNHVDTVHRLPDTVSFEQGILAQTAASPLWTIELMGGELGGRTVLVLGPGPIGLMAVQLARALGAARVILAGTRDRRLAVGRRLGADVTVNVAREPLRERVAAETGGLGADDVLECAGGATSLQDALECVRRGGRIGVTAFYGAPIQVDANLAALNQVCLYFSRGEGGQSCARSVALMAAGRLVGDPLVTHHFTLDEIHAAFATATGRKDEALKVAIHV